MSKNDIDVTFQAIDSHDKFYMEFCVYAVLGHPTTAWHSVDDCWVASLNPTQWAVQSNNKIDFCLVFETDFQLSTKENLPYMNYNQSRVNRN